MGSDEQIEVWLQARGYTLELASFDNKAHSPVFYVAAHDKRKEVLVAVRGTLSLSDAVTDMISAPLYVVSYCTFRTTVSVVACGHICWGVHWSSINAPRISSHSNILTTRSSDCSIVAVCYAGVTLHLSG